MNMIESKINAARFDYEFMGKTPGDLSKAYGFTLASIIEEIEINEWERKIEPTQLPETKDIQEFAEALENITRSKLSVISLFRQIEHQPLIAQLEKAFLEKALQLITSLDHNDDRAASKLANLVKSVNQIQERNPIDLVKQLNDQIEEGGGKVVVQIANHIQ